MTVDRAETALVAMRRILRAVELNARRLARETGLTASQIYVLQHLAELRQATAGDVARASGLRQPTVTALVDKLVARTLVVRKRDEDDRRRVWIEITDEGRRSLAGAPDTLQDMFKSRFARLEPWEQASLIAALERVASLLDAESLDAAPVLQVGPLDTQAKGEGEGE